MRHRAVGLSVLVAALALSATVFAQRDPRVASRIGTAAAPSPEAEASYLAAVASSEEAARSMQHALEIETARRVAPFDLD